MSQIGQYVTSSSGSGPVLFLNGNTGGPVGPTAGIINVVGSGVVSVSGNAGTSTLTISVSGSIPTAYTNVATSPYVVLVADEYISVNSSGGPIIIQLPNTATLSKVFVVKDRTGSAASNNITVTTVGGAINIDGATTFVMNTAYQSINIIGNGSTYEIY